MNLIARLRLPIPSPLTSMRAQTMAERLFRLAGLAPGCDARDLAIALRLDVCPRSGETEVRRGTAYYHWSLRPRDRNIALFRALAMHLHGIAGQTDASSIDALTKALALSPSGTFLRTA